MKKGTVKGKVLSNTLSTILLRPFMISKRPNLLECKPLFPSVLSSISASHCRGKRVAMINSLKVSKLLKRDTLKDFNLPTTTLGRNGFKGHITKTMQTTMIGGNPGLEKLRGYMNFRFGDDIKQLNSIQTLLRRRNTRLKNLLTRRMVKSMEINTTDFIDEHNFTLSSK